MTPATVSTAPFGIFNAVPGWLPFQAPERARVMAIRDRLLALGCPVSIRWSRGAGARAACGQLAVLDDAKVPAALRAGEVSP